MKCADCGEEYGEGRSHCPACGSNVVAIWAGDTLPIALLEHAKREAWRDQKVVGFRESEGRGQSSAAEESEDGTVSSWLAGRPTQGEGDTRQAARVLAQAMNRYGGQWDLADEEAVDAIDCILIDHALPANRLEVQVVRAIADTELYRALATANAISGLDLSPTNVAARMYGAVTNKADRLPFGIRRGLVLALDATRVSVCAMSSVVEAYRREFGELTRNVGFQQVWLIGPTDTMTQRLDK